MKQAAKYNSRNTALMGAFALSLAAQCAEGAPTSTILDSVKNEPGSNLPPALDELMGKVSGTKDELRLLDSVAKGVEIFKAEHGVVPTGDVIEAAIQQGDAAFRGIGPDGAPIKSLLDAVSNSASSSHSDPMSLQPNRAVVAILSAIAEAIPFASYLPVDIGSNQAKLAILAHTAGGAFGDYAAGAGMDGASAGKVYASASRLTLIDMTAGGGSGPYPGKFTTTNLANNPGFCDTAGAGVPVLRGRTIVYVNGKVAALDSPQGSGATSAIAGSVAIGSTTYTIAGTVTIATGAVSLTSVTPALPGGTVVVAEGFIDYEAAPALIPLVSVRADTFDIFANPWRAMTSVTIDTSTQMRNELSLDAASEAIMAMRTQMAMERHYNALGKVARLGANHVVTHDFDWASRKDQMNRAQIWQDFQAKLAVADQRMAEETMDHGITHLYVSSFIAGILNSLGSDMFVSSGIAARPSIYRVGRLFGKYECYYSPRHAVQAADLTTASIIGVGRSANVAQNAVVLGDAVSPTFLDLNILSDLKRSGAIYARDFTVVNPHEPSSLGCCRIDITNLG